MMMTGRDDNMEACDDCNNKCKHLSDCLDLMYNNMLQRCNINYKVEDKTTTEHKYEQKDNSLGEGIPFQRLRRITGYLVGDVSRWNNGKYAELMDREKHDPEEKNE